MKRLSIVLIVLLLSFIGGCTKAGEKVLLIFSYHPEYSWVIEETRGVEEGFKGKDVTVEKFYLDTKRKTSAEWKEEVAADAVKKIEEFKPDLVMVFDDNACELVAKRYIGNTLPFVFAGMNGDPEDYGFPAPNITGVIEREHLAESISLLRRLAPNVERIAMMTDNSPTARGLVARIRGTDLASEIHEIYTTDDFDEWKAKVAELQAEVDAIGLAVYHTIKENGSSVSLPAEDVLSWTLENSELPEFAIFDFTVRDGALCGATLSGYQQGKAATEIAIKILDGAKPADILITSPGKGNPIVNERRAEELDIAIPEDVRDEVEIVR